MIDLLRARHLDGVQHGPGTHPADEAHDPAQACARAPAPVQPG